MSILVLLNGQIPLFQSPYPISYVEYVGDMFLKFGNFCQILAYSRGFSSARWWFAGITRDVYVYARPKQHIRDLAVRAGSDGKLEVEVVPWRLL